jgi:predicted metal-dependent phosphoesterase TrpH
MKLRLDLHIHTEHSIDGFNTPRDIARRLREQGLDGYAVTDHDTLAGIKLAVAGSEGLIVVPGVEVMARGAHILAFQPVEPITPGLSIAETVDDIHGQGATAILAHPYGLPRSWVSMEEVNDAKLDAIEVCNSAQIPYGYIRNLNEDLARRLGLPRTGGSDSHIPETVGRAYTEVEADSSEPDAIVKAIRMGATSPQGSGITVAERLKKILKKKERKNEAQLFQPDSMS